MSKVLDNKRKVLCTIPGIPEKQNSKGKDCQGEK